MDQVLAFLKSQKIKNSGKFVSAGASKRGWTSLMIAAVDERVIANLAIVFDLINLVEVKFNFHFFKLCFMISIT